MNEQSNPSNDENTILDTLREEIAVGLRYLQTRANANTRKLLEIASFAYAAIDLLAEKRTAPDRGTRRTEENYRRTPMDFSASPVAPMTGKNPAVSSRWSLDVPPTPAPSEVEATFKSMLLARTSRSGSAATCSAPLSGRPLRSAQWRSFLGDRLGSH
jgi:hypothetical protein